MALPIVCVRQGEKFSERYTRMLRAMVAAHARAELLVLGDGPDADIPLRLHTGWHAKYELFRPDLMELRPFLYFDLDTYILGDISDLANFYPGDLWLLRDFNFLGKRRRRAQRSNSGIMLVPRETSKIWNSRTTHMADGDYLRQFPHECLQDRFAGIVSYKNTSVASPAGRVVCFHGKPKPHEASGWAGEVWERY